MSQDQSQHDPSWIFDDEDAEKHIYEFYTARYYETINKQPEKILDPIVKARIDARANHFALDQTKKLRDRAEKSFVFQVYEATRTGWFRNLDAEFDTIEELLASIVDAAEEGTTEAYNMAFLAETAIPLMKEAGITAEQVWGLPFQPAKAQLIVPAVRSILSCPVCGARTRHNGTECTNGHKLTLPEEKKEQVLKLVSMVADPETSSSEIRQKSAEIRGKAKQTLSALQNQGEVCVMPKDEGEWIIIKVPENVYTRAIEMKLKEILPEGFAYTDIWGLAKELSDKVKGDPVEPDPW